MKQDLYKMIFKRKSFHTFREKSDELLSDEDLQGIYDFYYECEALYPEIKTDIKIVRTNKTNCTRAAEYCIEFFSEIKDGYLQNIGYIGEQLDLYLVSKNIGSLWYGIAKQKDTYNGLNYVIMIAINKVDEINFRKDMFKAKRNKVEDYWSGDDLKIADIIRFAPSACNSQPWLVEHINNEIKVYRISKPKVGIMPKNASLYFNQIDIGIFMCFLELTLLDKGYKFIRELYKDNKGFNIKELNAIYHI